MCEKRYYRKSHLTVHMQKHKQHDLAAQYGDDDSSLMQEMIIPEVELNEYQNNSEIDLATYLTVSSVQAPRR